MLPLRFHFCFRLANLGSFVAVVTGDSPPSVANQKGQRPGACRPTKLNDTGNFSLLNTRSRLIFGALVLKEMKFKATLTPGNAAIPSVSPGFCVIWRAVTRSPQGSLSQPAQRLLGAGRPQNRAHIGRDWSRPLSVSMSEKQDSYARRC